MEKEKDELLEKVRGLYEEIRPPTDLSSPMFFNIYIKGEKGEEVVECADLATLEGFIQAYRKYSEMGMDISLEWEKISLH